MISLIPGVRLNASLLQCNRFYFRASTYPLIPKIETQLLIPVMFGGSKRVFCFQRLPVLPYT